MRKKEEDEKEEEKEEEEGKTGSSHSPITTSSPPQQRPACQSSQVEQEVPTNSSPSLERLGIIMVLFENFLCHLSIDSLK